MSENNFTSNHPAPVPEMPTQSFHPVWKKMPPKPTLKILADSKNPKGTVIINWTMKFTCQNAKIIKYQIYAYQEDISVKPDKSLWKKLSDIGVVNGLREHNSCSFKKIKSGSTTHFIIRAIDSYHRIGPFSSPGSIHAQ